MGDPAGIGGEIALKAWLDRKANALPPFFAIDDRVRLEAMASQLGLAVPIEEIEDPEAAIAQFGHALPLIPLPLAAPVQPGRPDRANAPAVLQSIERAVRLAEAGRAAAVVTNPVSKEILYGAGFNHPGQTEYLGELTKSPTAPVMMLACPGLRVVPVTVHLSLRDAIESLTSAAIVQAGRTTAAALVRDFGIAAPRLAVAGLNPHAGEKGALGHEEIDLISPAIEALQAEGIDVAGPAPADSLFHAAARGRYDAALCMYHDQALIPIKTINFEEGVNITLGLPVIRTSPDHGTAFDIAGSGKACPASLIAALHSAAAMAAARGRAP